MLQVIVEHRKAAITKWNHKLEDALAPALYAYETERVSGPAAVSANEEFQQAVKNLVRNPKRQLLDIWMMIATLLQVPPGQVFQGFPIAFTQYDPKRILTAMLKQTVARQLLQLSIAVHALRVRVVQYPEGVSTVWVLLAAHYLPDN